MHSVQDTAYLGTIQYDPVQYLKTSLNINSNNMLFFSLLIGGTVGL